MNERRILVALDGSPASESVLPVVTRLAQKAGRGLSLLYVIDPDMLEARDSDGRPAFIDQVLEWRIGVGLRYLERHRTQLAGQGVACDVAVEVGHPHEMIVQRARSGNALFIAMASHARSGMALWVLGSCGDQVLAHADRPVLLVQAGHQPPDEAISTVLLALDGSQFAEKAVPHAEGLAQLLGAHMMVIRSVRPSATVPLGQTPAPVEADVAGARRYAEFVAGHASAGVDAPDAFVGVGSPVQQVSDLARSTPGCVVVMSTHGQSGFSRRALGSVAHQILRRCGRAVFMIPPNTWEAGAVTRVA